MSNESLPASDEMSEQRWERALLEKAVLASVREQRSARRWKIFFRLVFLTVLCMLIWQQFSGGQAIPPRYQHIALIKIEGVIDSNEIANATDLNTALNKAFVSNHVTGIVLQINSPGGSPVQAERVYDEIRRLKAKYPEKPVYAVADELCASAAYYIAAATDKIFVSQASIVGSIGVLFDSFGFTGLMDKLGIERRVLRAGQNKAIGDPFSPQSAKQKQYLQALIDQVHAQFIKAVRQGRGHRLIETPETFSGLFWTGEKSVELGLADGFGDVNTIVRTILKAKNIVDYSVRENPLDRFLNRIGLAMRMTVTHTLTTIQGLK
jgi:protease IV